MLNSLLRFECLSEKDKEPISVKNVFQLSKLTKCRAARRFLLASLTAGLLFHPLSIWAQPFSPCDLNQDGVVNSADVTLAVQMVLGEATCPAVSMKGTGGCNVLMVQRVADATLSGGTCHPTVLTWAASSSSNIQGYNVYRSTTSGTYGPHINSSLITALTYTDGTSQPGVTYYYAVTAVDTSGNESTYSSPATAVITTP